MASDQISKRDLNRFKLLSQLQRHGPLRRGALSKACGIRISSATDLADELMAVGMIELQDPDRPRSAVTFTRDQWFVAVAAVTPGGLEFARVGITGEVAGHFRRDLAQAPTEQELESVLREGLERVRAETRGRLFGGGVALTGIVDSQHGIWHSAIHFPNVHRLALADALDQALGCPVLIENDARASLWGAIWFEPRLSSLRNVVYLSLCSGIGSALLINGQPYAGTHFWAGELGHMPAGEEGRECCCGRSDCLETYCSIPALEMELARVIPTLGRNLTALELAGVISKNPVAANIADRVMARVGKHLGRLAAYVDPEVILLGEQEPALYQALLPSLRCHIQSEFYGRGDERLPIEIVSKPEFAPLRGVAAMVIHEAFQNTLSPLYQRRPVF